MFHTSIGPGVRLVSHSAGLATVIFYLGMASLRGSGMTDDYLVDVWNSENGLPDSSVTATAQTPDGYLWVGTYNGLARFDGVRFASFDPANTPALAHARIRRLSVDNQGVLWISTYDGSLTRYQEGSFSLEHRNTHSSEGDVVYVSSSSNQWFFLTSRGELLHKPFNALPGQGWVELPPPARGIGAMCCQDGAGTIWYRDGDRHLWRLNGNGFESLPDSAGLAGQDVHCLTVDSHSRFWVGTDHGFAVWNGSAFQSATPADPDSLMDVECLTVTDDSHVWAVANGCICEAFNGQWLLPPQPPRNVFSGANGHVLSQPDHRGGIWFYNYGRGLFHADAAGHIRQLTTEDGFPGDRVYCLGQDREGNWWAGLDAAGLVRIRSRQFHAVQSAEKDLTTAARTVCEDENSMVWVGRLSGGLACGRESDFTNLTVADSAGANSVFCACPGLDGRLWLSSGDENLWVHDRQGFKRIDPLIHGVKALLCDHLGRIWVGTTTTLMVSDPNGESFQPYKNITHRTVRALAEDKLGNIWVGTGSGDLFCVTTNAVAMFHPSDNQESGAIWSVLSDTNGTEWIGTFRGGLLRFRDGAFTRYGKRDGLPDNVICQIVDDGRGNLWLGSHQGVLRVAKAELNAYVPDQNKFIQCITYGRSDGMPSEECSGGYQPASWHDHAGRLWFTTSKGATWVQPDDVQPNRQPPPVVIEEILVDGRRWDLPQNKAAVKIPPGRHQVELHYTGLSLASPDRVQFRYQLEGLDTDWIQAGTRRTAQYNFLPPAEYRFHVLACNSDGVWNETGSILRFDIQPHYYETWWFRTAATLFVLGSVAGLVRYTATRRLHRQVEHMERRQAIERERARIAKDIHDDLGATLTLIAVLGDLARREKTGERIEKMSATAREAVKSLDEIVWAVNPRNDTLVHLVDYMGQFAAGYLRDAGIRCLLDVPEQTPEREVPANVRHNVFLVVKEALQNIVKHAHATEVWLRISAGPHGLSISIEDNGCGFERPPKDAWADGLKNMRQRLAEVGGECRIVSRVNAGTTITVELPLAVG